VDDSPRFPEWSRALSGGALGRPSRITQKVTQFQSQRNGPARRAGGRAPTRTHTVGGREDFRGEGPADFRPVPARLSHTTLENGGGFSGFGRPWGGLGPRSISLKPGAWGDVVREWRAGAGRRWRRRPGPPRWAGFSPTSPTTNAVTARLANTERASGGMRQDTSHVRHRCMVAPWCGCERLGSCSWAS
jgi:hypothetical protein